MNKKKLIKYLVGELDLSQDSEGELIFSFPEDKTEQVADEILKVLEEK